MLGFPTFIMDPSHLAPAPRVWMMTAGFQTLDTRFCSSNHIIALYQEFVDFLIPEQRIWFLLLSDYTVLLKIMGHALSNPGRWTARTMRLQLSCHSSRNGGFLTMCSHTLRGARRGLGTRSSEQRLQP